MLLRKQLIRMSKHKKLTIASWSFVVLVILVGGISKFLVNKSPKVFSICKVEKTSSRLKGPLMLYYTYQFKGEVYSYSYPTGTSENNGDCFIVEIPLRYTGKGKILVDYPTNGYCELGVVWDEIPPRFKAMKVEKY